MDAHRNDTGFAITRRTRAQRIGDAGEADALAFLIARGLRPLARNVRYKAGEIDLVMLDGATLVFVEVRRRGRTDFGDALDSVDARKARKLATAARLYLQRHAQHATRDCRFDVVGFDADAAPRWVRGAFTLDDV
jgi:putative endonuclease